MVEFLAYGKTMAHQREPLPVRYSPGLARYAETAERAGGVDAGDDVAGADLIANRVSSSSGAASTVAKSRWRDEPMVPLEHAVACRLERLPLSGDPYPKRQRS